MNPIKQFASALSFLQPRRPAIASAASALRDLARQARTAVRKHLPSRHTERPTQVDSSDVGHITTGHLNNLKSMHRRNTEENEKLFSFPEQTHIEDFSRDLANSKPAMDGMVVASASQAEPATVESLATRIDNTAAQRDTITTGHSEVTKAMNAAHLNQNAGTRASELVKGMQVATEALAAIAQFNTEGEGAKAAYTGTIGAYAAQLDNLHKHAVVLRADAMIRGVDQQALDKLVAQLAAQRKAVAAYAGLFAA